MNLTMMILFHDLGDHGGPKTPRPADPSPEGGEGEPVGDDDDDDEAGEESSADIDRADARGGAI